jgi:hypothetical protein
MSLLSDIAAVLPGLRAEAEALMVDAGTAKRPAGGYTNVGGDDVLATTDLFTSPCKIQTRNLQARESEVGARTSVAVRTELHLPVSTAALTVGDLFTITTVADYSLSTVGQTFRVTGPVSGTWKTARRYEVEEVVS